MADDHADNATADTTGEPQSLLDTTGTQQGPSEWFWAEGVKGSDRPPEWFKADKYKSVAEQARAYAELEKKYGEISGRLKGFAGAPEKYELSLPDDLKDQVEWSTDDPLLKEFQDFARSKGMDQETFTGLLHMFAKYEFAQTATDLAAEKAALGERADERLSGFHSWAKANLSEEQLGDVMRALSPSARPSTVFKAFEAVMQANRQPSLRPSDDVRADGPQSEAEWRTKWYAKSDMKGYQYKIDEPGMREKARAELAAIVGTGDHIEVVGKRKAG